MSLTKLEVLNLDLPIWSYKIYKTALKTGIFELSSQTQSLTWGTRLSVGPTSQRDETEEAAFDGAAVVLLADGEDSGDTKATYVLYVTRGTDWCKWQGLRPSRGGLSPVMAARQSSGASYRRRQAMAGSTELGTSFRRSLPCYPSKEQRTGKPRG